MKTLYKRPEAPTFPSSLSEQTTCAKLQPVVLLAGPHESRVPQDPAAMQVAERTHRDRANLLLRRIQVAPATWRRRRRLLLAGSCLVRCPRCRTSRLRATFRRVSTWVGASHAQSPALPRRRWHQPPLHALVRDLRAHAEEGVAQPIRRDKVARRPRLRTLKQQLSHHAHVDGVVAAIVGGARIAVPLPQRRSIGCAVQGQPPAGLAVTVTLT